MPKHLGSLDKTAGPSSSHMDELNNMSSDDDDLLTADGPADLPTQATTTPLSTHPTASLSTHISPAALPQPPAASKVRVKSEIVAPATTPSAPFFQPSTPTATGTSTSTSTSSTNLRSLGWSPSSFTKSFTKSVTKSSPAHTNRLYEDAQNRASKLESLRLSTLRKCTLTSFQPTLIASPSTTTQTGNPFHRLHKNAALHTSNIESVRLKEETRNAAVHTFKPNLATRSSPAFKKVMKEGDEKGETVVQRCFGRAATISLKRASYAKKQQEKECSFSPDLAKRSPVKGNPMNLSKETAKDSSLDVTASSTAELINRLYQPKQFEEKARKREARKQELEARECSYQPTVNRGKVGVSSTTTVDAKTGEEVKAPAGSTSDAACLRLYQKGHMENQRFKVWRGEQVEKYEKKECTFTPTVDTRKGGGERRKSTSSAPGGGGGAAESGRRVQKGDIFERLYVKEHKVFHTAADENLTFQPKIISKKVKSEQVAKLTSMPLDERFNYLYEQGVSRQATKRNLPKNEKEEIRRRVEEEEMKECTFTPRTTWKKVFGNLEREDEVDYVGVVEVMEVMEVMEGEEELEFGGEWEGGGGYEEEEEEGGVYGEEEGEITGIADILGEVGVEEVGDDGGRRQSVAWDEYALEAGGEEEYVAADYAAAEYAGDEKAAEYYEEGTEGTEQAARGHLATAESSAFSLGLDHEDFEFEDVEAVNELEEKAVGYGGEEEEEEGQLPEEEEKEEEGAADENPFF